jgi:hypothetical protein
LEHVGEIVFVALLAVVVAAEHGIAEIDTDLE